METQPLLMPDSLFHLRPVDEYGHGEVTRCKFSVRAVGILEAYLFYLAWMSDGPKV